MTGLTERERDLDSRLVARGRLTRDPEGAVTWRPPDREPRPTGGSWS